VYLFFLMGVKQGALCGYYGAFNLMALSMGLYGGLKGQKSETWSF
jgi:hypothetical protein